MNVFRDLSGPVHFPDGCVVAAGNFDGVHLGHQEVLRTAVSRSGRLGLPPVLLTFASHPLEVVNPGSAPVPLMSVDDRLSLAEQAGFRDAVILDFDRELASMPPETFAEKILAGMMNARELVAGQGWRFGKGRAGDMKWLSVFGKGAGFEVTGVRPVMSEGRPVSSTWIRECLARGDVREAALLLGRRHYVRATVIHGEGRGRELGFPTVNLDSGGVLVPARGVYSGAYRAGKEAGAAALSVGTAPTFVKGTASPTAVEAHLIGFEGDLYGEMVTVAFDLRLRDQRLFTDTAALSEQIARDVEAVKQGYGEDTLKGIPPS